MRVFAIRDLKLGAFGAPFFQPNRAVAIRTFERSCVAEGSDFAAFPGDYSMYEIGEYNEDSGKLIGFEPDFVVAATDFFNRGN